MDYSKNSGADQLGNIEIADDVIATMVSVSALEVEGVAALAPRSYADQAIKGLMGAKKAPATIGVKVDVGDSVSVEVNIIVKLGSKVQDVALGVQRKVKTAVESMSGLEVKKVDVFVAGIEGSPAVGTEENR